MEVKIKMKCMYCETVTQTHPEGLHSWTGYACRNDKSDRFHNSRSTIEALCEECESYKNSKED